MPAWLVEPEAPPPAEVPAIGADPAVPVPAAPGLLDPGSLPLQANKNAAKALVPRPKAARKRVMRPVVSSPALIRRARRDTLLRVAATLSPQVFQRRLAFGHDPTICPQIQRIDRE
jgi:hypothetical protein